MNAHERYQQAREADAKAQRDRERAATTPEDIEFARKVRELDAAGQAIVARRLLASNPTSYARGSAALREAENPPPAPEAA